MPCPYYNESKSDPWNGIYCEKVNGRPGVAFWGKYCNHNYSRCPHQGGDDPYELVIKHAPPETKRDEPEQKKEAETHSSYYYTPDPEPDPVPTRSASTSTSSSSSVGGGGIMLFDNLLFKIFAYFGIFIFVGGFSIPTSFYGGIDAFLNLEPNGALTDILIMVLGALHFGGAMMLAAYSVDALGDGYILKGLVGPILAIALLYGNHTSAGWLPVLQVISSIGLYIFGLPCAVLIGAVAWLTDMIVSHVTAPGGADSYAIAFLAALIAGIIFSVKVIGNKHFSPFYPPNWIYKIKRKFR